SHRPPPHSPSFPTRRSSDLGRPIVATATPASRDYVTEGVNGLLVPPGDPQAMAAAIERLDTHPELLAALAAGARAAAATFTTERSEEHTSELQSRSDLVCRL